MRIRVDFVISSCCSQLSKSLKLVVAMLVLSFLRRRAVNVIGAAVLYRLRYFGWSRE
jgi:hypothetical protein